jgi:hypothetical protein
VRSLKPRWRRFGTWRSGRQGRLSGKFLFPIPFPHFTLSSTFSYFRMAYHKTIRKEHEPLSSFFYSATCQPQNANPYTGLFVPRTRSKGKVTWRSWWCKQEDQKRLGHNLKPDCFPGRLYF